MTERDIEAKKGVKPFSASGEKTFYDFCLPERAVTLGCVQFQALMVSENAQGDLNRKQTIIAEDKDNLYGDCLNASFCC